jgi:hypothetical protein
MKKPLRERVKRMLFVAKGGFEPPTLLRDKGTNRYQAKLSSGAGK